MKRKPLLAVYVALAALAVGVLPGGGPGASADQPGPQTAPKTAAGKQPFAPTGTAFTYQGKLKDGANPANGQYDFQFRLYDALAGGNQVGSTIALANQSVTDGLLKVALDFGAGTMQGDLRWLEVDVRQAGGGAYTTLSPRDAVTAVPYAQSLVPGAVVQGSVSGYNSVLKSSNTANGFGLWGESTGAGGIGVLGSASNATSTGVYGTSPDTGVTGFATQRGVYGLATGYGAIGVHGVSNNGGTAAGVRGESSSGYGLMGMSNSGLGVYATSGGAAGVWGDSSATGQSGVMGRNTSQQGGFGVQGQSNSSYAAVYGDSTGSGAGVYGTSTIEGVAGIYGKNTGASGGYGVRGDSTTGYAAIWGNSTAGSGGTAVFGSTTGTSSVAVRGTASGEDSTGVRGVANGGYYATGVYGSSDSAYGVTGQGHIGVQGLGTVWGGYFAGDGRFTGDLSVLGSCCAAAEGTFRIDHPDDPANKYLYQAAVESPDMMNVYSGNVTTDAAGEAVVVLPSYVESYNKDFRYQLTVMGQFAQAIVSSKVKGNSFTIKTDRPNVEVSWQVTGIRKDPYANSNRVQAEVNKVGAEQGKYIHPELYGQPESKRIDPQNKPGWTRP